MQIAVRIDDLAYVAADAVARPVNADLRAVTPVIRRLEHAAGDALLRQLHVHEPLEIGAAVVTPAGDVAADLMIHAVISTDRERASRDGVRRATTSVLQRAHDFGIARLAIAPFGLGAGNLDVDDVAQTMLSAIASHGAERIHPQDLTIVVENDLELEVFQHAVDRFRRER